MPWWWHGELLMLPGLPPETARHDSTRRGGPCARRLAPGGPRRRAAPLQPLSLPCGLQAPLGVPALTCAPAAPPARSPRPFIQPRGTDREDDQLLERPGAVRDRRA